jgi:hypothetical protein
MMKLYQSIYGTLTVLQMRCLVSRLSHSNTESAYNMTNYKSTKLYKITGEFIRGRLQLIFRTIYTVYRNDVSPFILTCVTQNSIVLEAHQCNRGTFCWCKLICLEGSPHFVFGPFYVFPCLCGNDESIELRRMPSSGILSVWLSCFLQELHNDFPADGILHSNCREKLKSYIALTGWTV